MNRYITRGIANYLPTTLQHQLWQLVAQRENEQSKNRSNRLLSYLPVQHA